MKEKMLNEELYIADEELLKERDKVKDLCHEYNNLLPSNRQKQNELIKQIVKSIGLNPFIEQPFMCDYGYNIEIGDNFYSNHNLIILDPAKVIIGNNVFIGPNVSIYTAYHPLDKDLRNEGYEQAKKIIIKDNVWIGGSVIILPDVTIGENSVIGAGSVVTKDVPPNTVVAGNPAKIIKKINHIEKI